MTVIIVFALILSNYVSSSGAEGIYTDQQLLFVAAMTLVLFTAFTLFQTIGHRDYFLPVVIHNASKSIEHSVHIPSDSTTFKSLVLLV